MNSEILSPHTSSNILHIEGYICKLYAHVMLRRNVYTKCNSWEKWHSLIWTSWKAGDESDEYTSKLNPLSNAQLTATDTNSIEIRSVVSEIKHTDTRRDMTLSLCINFTHVLQLTHNKQTPKYTTCDGYIPWEVLHTFITRRTDDYLKNKNMPPPHTHTQTMKHLPRVSKSPALWNHPWKFP
jgi:hypothetical protein